MSKIYQTADQLIGKTPFSFFSYNAINPHDTESVSVCRFLLNIHI